MTGITFAQGILMLLRSCMLSVFMGHAENIFKRVFDDQSISALNA